MTGHESRPARDIRVLIADDEALVRAGFKVLVDSAPGLSVVGEASDGVQAVRQARALKPDVVLMDIRMPVMGGLEATKLILDGDQDPPPRILVVTTFDRDEHVFEALRGGASGFVLKDTPPEKLLDAITIVAAGEALLAPAITRRLIAEFARQPRAAARPAEDALAQLTERERDVLQQVAAGSPTPRSPPPCTCPWPRSRPTSAVCSTSWAAAIARSSSWSRTRPASPFRAGGDRRLRPQLTAG